MASASPWPLIHAERAAFAADLATLEDSQWNTRSLSGERSVGDMPGHTPATAKMTPLRFFAQLAADGFRFHAITAKGAGPVVTGPAFALARAMAGRAAAPDDLSGDGLTMLRSRF
ncbi:MAG TPA: hypothetical protein VMK13_04230 [Streptosporangiaceae bacterium]|nr:hypothetical protein [Streptosporangiaceae bacterium]